MKVQQFSSPQNICSTFLVSEFAFGHPAQHQGQSLSVGASQQVLDRWAGGVHRGVGGCALSAAPMTVGEAGDGEGISWESAHSQPEKE